MSALSLMTIPIYIRLLGAEKWGLLAACATLQLLFNFIDSGFSQIVPRWVARNATQMTTLRCLARRFVRIYWLLACVGWLFLQASAGYLASSWFQVPLDQVVDLEWAIRIIAFQLMFQFLNSLSVAIWIGRQQQPRANLRMCLFATVKHATAVAALMAISADAWVYASAFALVSLAEWLFNTRTVRRELEGGSVETAVPPPADADFLREVSVLSLGIVIGLATSQLDRIVLSRAVSVSEFGVYVVVLNMAMAFLQLQTPLSRALFPRLVREMSTRGAVSTNTMCLFLVGNVVFAAIPALLASMFTEPLLQAWIRDAHFAQHGSLPLKLLLWSVAINVVYGCIYHVIVASGHAHLVLRFNLAGLAVGCGVVMALGAELGLALGGAIWLATTTTQLVLGLTWFLLRHRGTAAAAKQA